MLNFPAMETWQDDTIAYRGKIISLRTGNVRLLNGGTAFREVIEHPGGVGVIPYLESENAFVLIRQFRIALNRSLIECPAGKIEGDDEPEHRGRVELEEETGYRAGRMIPLGHIHPSVGFLNERIHLYLAVDLTPTKQNLEHDEVIELVHIPVAEVHTRLADYSIEDAKTVVGLYRALEYLERQGS